MTTTTEHKVWVIVADGIFDQVVESPEDRDKEVADLRSVGFRVKAHGFATWAEAEDYADMIEGRP